MPLPPFGWHDRPNTATPLSAAELEAFGLYIANYFDQGSGNLATLGSDGAVGGPGGTPLTTTTLLGQVVNAGNLGSSHTIDFASRVNTILTVVGTLNADCTITFTNRAAGCRAILLLVQDGSGNHALNVSDGSNSSPVSVTSNPNQLTSIEVDCPNTTDIYLSLFSVPSTATTPATSVSLGNWLGVGGSTHVAGFGALTQWSTLGFTVDRVEIKQPALASTVLTDVATCLTNGAKKIIVTTELSNYASASTFPTAQATLDAFAAYFVGIVQAVTSAHPTVPFFFEITNEPWEPTFWATPATASTYAALVVTVLNACFTAGIDLTTVYPMAKDSTWPNLMVIAQATLSTLIKGWSIHPYGAAPPGAAGLPSTQGVASIPFFRQQLLVQVAGVGATNIIVSEIGTRDRTVDGSATASSESVALTAAQAILYPQQILQALDEMHDAGWLQLALWYSFNDGGWATNAAGGALTNIGTALAQFPLPIRQFVTSVYRPSQDGMLAVTMEPMSANDAVQLTVAKLHLFAVNLDERTFAQNLPTFIDTGGSSLTASQCVACIYDQLGNLRSTSADQSPNWTTSGRKPNNFPGGSNFKPGPYWLGLLANGSVMPKFRGKLIADQANWGNGGTLPTRSMISVTSYTAPPGTITLTAGGAGGVTSLDSSILMALA